MEVDMHPSVTPIAYTLTVEPDLDRFEFAGRVRMDVRAAEPVDAVELDCAELAIWHCRLITGDSDQQEIDCPFTLDPAETGLTVQFPGTVSGDFQLCIDYRGKINDGMAGFYRSAIAVPDGPDHIAVTQFQESDARTGLPLLWTTRHKRRSFPFPW
jgi:aminopeptidase 2